MRSSSQMRKRVPWVELLFGIIFLSATVYAALSDAYNLPNRWFIRDDAYYYFKVAQNISEGHGSTFDGIHLTNGYHPLWLLICIPVFALTRYDLILPLRVLAVITGVLQYGTAMFLYRLVRMAVSPAAGFLTAAYWLFNSYILLFLFKTGVESGIALLALTAFLYLVYKFDTSRAQSDRTIPRIAVLGAFALLTTLGRLDLAFISIVIGVWIIFRGTAIRYLLPLDALAILVSTVAAFLFRLGFAAYYDASASVEIMMSVASLITIPMLFVLGLYEPPSSWKPWRAAVRLGIASVGASLITSVVLLVGGGIGWFPTFSRYILIFYSGLSFGLLLAIRAGIYLLRQNRNRAPNSSPLALLRLSWRRWLTEGAVYYGIFGAGMAIYMIWNRLAFGTFTPVSGQIKHWWGTFVHSIYGTNANSWLTFFALNPFSDFNAWAPPTSAFSDWSNRILYSEATGFGNPRWRWRRPG